MRVVRSLCAAAAVAIFQPGSPAASLPSFDHIVIVVMENRSDTAIIGNAQAPYINSLAAHGALFTNSFAIEHPSQPNYLDLFSGSNQGVTSNQAPSYLFTTSNLGAGLIAKGLTFIGYAESLPSVGFTEAGDYPYARRHNPWVNWQGSATNGVPASSNRPFSDFPSDFDSLPTVSFVVPDLLGDMHDTTVAYGDMWLTTHIDAYAQWAKLNNSLLILTWDEDDSNGANQIATIFVGAHIVVGEYDERIDHFSVLRTVEDVYGLEYAGSSAAATPITDVFVTTDPEINRHPSGLTVAEGSDAVFRVEASGTPPLTYQWFKGTDPIDGAINATYTAKSVSASDTGAYYVVVSHAPSSVTSRSAILTVKSPAPDNKPSIVSISGPARRVVHTARYIVHGTAEDAASGVAAVYVKIAGRASYAKAAGSTRWSKKVVLGIGLNRVKAYAVDKSGNVSAVDSATIVRK